MEEKEYHDLIPKAEAELKISLRAKQVETALDGSVPMLIWLGKQMLGQKEKLEHSDEGGARQVDLRFLGGHLKTGQLGSLQNRPVEAVI